MTKTFGQLETLKLADRDGWTRKVLSNLQIIGNLLSLKSLHKRNRLQKSYHKISQTVKFGPPFQLLKSILDLPLSASQQIKVGPLSDMPLTRTGHNNVWLEATVTMDHFQTVMDDA